MNSFNSLKQKHLQTGLYKIDDNSNIYAELCAYAKGLDVLFDLYDEILREFFIDTAQSYGLTERERFIGVVNNNFGSNDRREIIKTREYTNENFCTPSAFNKILESYGLKNFKITENFSGQIVTISVKDNLTSTQKDYVRSMIAQDFPIHLNVNVVFS